LALEPKLFYLKVFLFQAFLSLFKNFRNISGQKIVDIRFLKNIFFRLKKRLTIF